MRTRLCQGKVYRLNGQPMTFPFVAFELTNTVIVGQEVAAPHVIYAKANDLGVIQIELITGGDYRMYLNDSNYRLYVEDGETVFNVWAQIELTAGLPPSAVIRGTGGELSGALFMGGNRIDGATIDSSNAVLSPIFANGDRPDSLAVGQSAYDPTAGILWVGNGGDVNYLANGLQSTPTPPQGKGWNEYILRGSNSVEPASAASFPAIVTSDDLTGNIAVITHPLSTLTPDITVFDPDGLIVELVVQVLGTDHISVNFEGLLPLTGSYKVLIEK